AHDLERRHDAERTIELAASRLRVEMAPDQHGRQAVVRAGPAREHGAHAVDRDRAAGLAAPISEEVARLAVEVRQRQAVDATLWCCADLRHFHEAVPQSLAVDFEIAVPGHDVLSLISVNSPATEQVCDRQICAWRAGA